MGVAERVRWGIGTLPITGTPVNISYWIYTNTIPSAAAVGSSYLASRYVVSPAVYRAVAWASKATGNPVSAQFVSKRMTEFTQLKMLKMLGFKEGVGKTALRALPRSSLGGVYAMQKSGPLVHRAYHTGAGAMRWAPGPILRSLGWVGLGYEAHKLMSHKHQSTGMSMYDVMNPTNDEVWKTSFWG